MKGFIRTVQEMIPLFSNTSASSRQSPMRVGVKSKLRGGGESSQTRVGRGFVTEIWGRHASPIKVVVNCCGFKPLGRATCTSSSSVDTWTISCHYKLYYICLSNLECIWRVQGNIARFVHVYNFLIQYF